MWGLVGKLRKHAPTESLTSATVPLSNLLPTLRPKDPYHATSYADVWGNQFGGDFHTL
jgi:hypothetical protein